VMEFQITDPRGAKIKEDKVTLNGFGSAWGSLDLDEKLPLGEYRATFWDQGRKHQIGYATLFRLEEYRLPEFKVTVQTPEENGHKKAFRVGDKVEVHIQSDYYFGGAVANASVEVLVYQNAFYHYWHRSHEFAWFYQDMENDSARWRYSYGGQGQVIKRETLKTDAFGKASLTFDTPRNSGQDFEYRIEARVTDSSRREIIGNGTVRVTRQRYYVYTEPGHNLYRPQDKVAVEFKALDANEQPVQAEGTVKVTRDYWFEIWLDPEGKEVKGDELKRVRALQPIFPPPPARPNAPGWQLKFQGYEHEDILTRALKTDTNGAAQFTFTPEREGYYRVAWTSEDRGRPSQPPAKISANTTVWVATGTTTEVGYRHGGVEIIVDKDTFRTGQKAPVMLVAQSNDRNVLFTVEGEDLYSYQLVHLDGTVKLIELNIEEKHVPNIFLSATLVSDRQLFIDTKQVIVPPTQNFLTVEVEPDRKQYQPQEEGTFTIRARNDRGEPVSAELAFGAVDESVFYIQQDYAGDPRQFFYGAKRNQLVQTQSTMNQKTYARLVKDEKEQLIDDLYLEQRKNKDQAGYRGRDRNGAYYFSENEVASDKLSEATGIGGSVLAAAKATRGFGQAPTAPASSSLALMDARREMRAPAEMPAPGTPPPGQPEAPVQVRSDFRSTIVWQPDLKTDRDGKATVKLKYPDSLTTWKATARAVSSGNQFGIGETSTRTKQPLIVRLEAPRFFVVGDQVTISAIINNNTDEPLLVYPKLEVQGLVLTMDAGGRDPNKLYRASYSTNVAANSEARVDFQVLVKSAGPVKLLVSGRSDKHSDAMEKSFIAFEHGIEKFVSKSGKVRQGDLTISLELPKERKPGSTSLTVQVTPSMAVTMLDALPYLIDYPYGCTEQTMSRFLPAVITAKTLKDMGLQPEDVMSRVFGGIEAASALATHPRGKKDLQKLNEIVNAGLDRLYDFQHSDGGWAWWKEGDSDHWMTAYVLWGLSLARDAKVTVRSEVLNRAASYLEKTLVDEEQNFDMQAFMLHALAAWETTKREPSTFQTRAFENLWNNREKLNAYTRSLLALTAHAWQDNTRAQTLIENLENGVKRDNRPDASVLIGSQPSTPNSQPSTIMGTAHWGEDGIYWRWSDGGVEATAFALRALLAIDPKNKLIEPVTNWLVKNRRGAQWNSTRDTAIVVLAMNDYLKASGELNADLEYQLVVNGSTIATKKVSGPDVFAAPSRFTVDPKLIKDSNTIQIRRKHGDSPIYFAVEGQFFSLEEPITAAGNEIFVKRQYYKLVGRPTLLKGYVYDKQPLNDGDSVKSGERIETLLTIEGKNNYEYLMFEDLKPAGFEAVEVRSGESVYARELKSGAVEHKFGSTGGAETSEVKGAAAREKDEAKRMAGKVRPAAAIRPIPAPVSGDDSDYTGRSRYVYQELRDRKVALFIDKLPEGVWEIRYDLRAEVPGQFHGLPVIGAAMYVPEIRCNGAETRVSVVE
jgi:alpha-2-macroglobulin